MTAGEAFDICHKNQHANNPQLEEAWQILRAFVFEHQENATPTEDRDCDTCENDGECFVTMLKCKGYVRATQEH